MSSPIQNKLSIGDIISRAWRLYRLNAPQVFFYAFIPALIMCISKVLLNLPGVLRTNNDIATTMLCFLTPGIIIFFIGIFVSIFFNYCLFKAFYNILTMESYHYKEILGIAKAKLIKIIKLSLIISAEAIVFIVLDLILIFSILLVLMLPFYSLINTILSNPVFKIPTILFVSISVFIILYIYIQIISLQMLFCGLQIINFAVKKESLIDSFVSSFEMIRKNFAQACLLGVGVYLLTYVLIGFFNMPSFILIVLLKTKIALFEQEMLYLVLLSLLEIWNTIVNFLLWPFVVSCITIFYFYCRVKQEGLDLNLSIIELKQMT